MDLTNRKLALPLSGEEKLTVTVILAVVGFTILTGLAALARIPLPFTPVPMTLQTLSVLLAGAFLGRTGGSASQTLYLAWGISGLPLFAGGAVGIAALTGPTGGYLIGFVLAAALVFLVFTSGAMLILLFGWIHLALQFSSPVRAFNLGVLPFLPGDLLKAAAATGIWSAFRPLLNRK
jgi:biotin transport system substrate-specific component